MSTYECDAYDCECSAKAYGETGVIRKWPRSKNFGFIDPDRVNKQLFVHVTGTVSHERLDPGVRVKFDVWQECQTGKYRAVGVRPIRTEKMWHCDVCDREMKAHSKRSHLGGQSHVRKYLQSHKIVYRYGNQLQYNASETETIHNTPKHTIAS